MSMRWVEIPDLILCDALVLLSRSGLKGYFYAEITAINLAEPIVGLPYGKK